MEDLNVFVNKHEIDYLFEKEEYRNCMDKKYFEYIVSNGKIEYIDKYLKDSKNKTVVENLVFKNKAVKVIDKLLVKIENNRYVGMLENIGIDNIEVSKEIEAKYQNRILTKGVFALIKLEENIDKKYHYYIEEIEELEDININLDDYKKHFSNGVHRIKLRKQREYSIDLSLKEIEFTAKIDLVLNSIGISTAHLTFWEKVLYLIRLIPLCEANYNLMELGGNGIGKTKTYSMFSPECEIVQEMLTTELIYNMQSKKKGLLDTKDVIVFDEVNKIKLDGDKEKIITQLLHFMADGKTTSPRKVISKTSFVFSGNVTGIQERIEKNEKNVFDNPHKFEDNAFLDRIHFFLPAWGLRRYTKKIHGSKLENEVFRFDYFSKILSLFREKDYSVILDEKGYDFENGSKREILAIRKTVSGLLKLTYPEGDIDDTVLEAYIAIAIKGRGLINKFLNNKNRNNVNKINIEVGKIDNNHDCNEVDVNESLQRIIYTNSFDDLNEKFEIYKEHIYNYYVLKENKFRYFSKKKEVEDHTSCNLRFYPNRLITLFNYERDKGEIVFIKIALDNIGIIKNRREELMIKEIYGEKSIVDLLAKGRILIFIIRNEYNRFRDKLNITNNLLFDKEELNYDGLFGDKSFDINDFTGKSPDSGTRRFEADISNIYKINTEKQLKCEDGSYIIPKFMYDDGLEKYYYKDSRGIYLNGERISDMMNYVEFKYFLANNGFIELESKSEKSR